VKNKTTNDAKNGTKSKTTNNEKTGQKTKPPPTVLFWQTKQMNQTRHCK